MELFKLGNTEARRTDRRFDLKDIENMPFDPAYEIHRSRFNWGK